MKRRGGRKIKVDKAQKEEELRTKEERMNMEGKSEN